MQLKQTLGKLLPGVLLGATITVGFAQCWTVQDWEGATCGGTPENYGYSGIVAAA